MSFTDGWDVALFSMAGYVAVVVLVRLMIQHRDKLLARFRSEMEQEKLRQKQLEKRTKKEEKAKAGGKAA